MPATRSNSKVRAQRKLMLNSPRRRNADVVDQAAAAGMQIYGDIFAIPSAVLDQTIKTALRAKDAIKGHAKRILHRNPSREENEGMRRELLQGARTSRSAQELARIHKWAVSRGDSELKNAAESRARNLGLDLKGNYPRGWNPQVTDRAPRYRANANAPEGPEQCAMCGSKTSIDVGHIDGHEENNEEWNLMWVCRSCNVASANTMRAAGLGRLTHQYNPAGQGAKSVKQWITAVMSMKGLSSEMPVSEAVELVHNTSAKKRSEYARQIWDMRRGKRNPRTKQNSEAGAAHFYQKFHGRESGEEVIIETEIREHRNLGTVGVLVCCVVDTPSGVQATIRFDSDDGDQVPFLCSSPDGCQLFIEGGNQELDLKALKLDGEEWRKERMVIGQFSDPEPGRKFNICYIAAKSFDDFEDIEYQHDLGEPDEGEPKSHRREAPILEYDTMNKLLYIVGGQYKIDLPFWGVSPGIEN